MGTPAEAFARLLEIVHGKVLDRMEIPYAVAGSAASSVHGIPRTTLDIDLVVDLKADRIDSFAAELRQEFYADAALIRDAFALGRAANLIHLATAWKFDLFPLRKDEYSRTEFARRSFREIRPDGLEAQRARVCDMKAAQARGPRLRTQGETRAAWRPEGVRCAASFWRVEAIADWPESREPPGVVCTCGYGDTRRQSRPFPPCENAAAAACPGCGSNPGATFMSRTQRALSLATMFPALIFWEVSETITKRKAA